MSLMHEIVILIKCVTHVERDLGELTRTFVIKGDSGLIYLRSRKYWLDYGYMIDEESGLRREDPMFLALSRGTPSRNLYGFSLEKAHRKILIRFVPSDAASSISVYVDFPWMYLLKDDLKSVETMVESFATFLTSSLAAYPLATAGEEQEWIKLYRPN